MAKAAPPPRPAAVRPRSHEELNRRRVDEERRAQFTVPIERADQLTDAELLELIQRRDNPLSKAWQAFRSGYARIGQKCEQAKPPGILEIRRMELDVVLAILREAGIGVKVEPEK